MKATREISTTDLRDDLPRVLEQVKRGERVAITRYGEPVALIVGLDDDPAADLDAAYAALDAMGEAPSASVLDLLDESRARYDRSAPSE